MKDSPDDRDIRMSRDGTARGESGILPRELQGYFPRLEPPSPGDLEVLRRQIGRRPAGRVMVAARCPRERPAVILTVPFAPREGRMPPLLWLSCPSASRGAAGLEAEGCIAVFTEMLDDRRDATASFMLDEERFSRALLVAASVSDRALAERLGARGVAGGRQGVVKCLHAHMAYRLAAVPARERTAVAETRGLIGKLCIEELERRSGVWCERIPEACVYRHGD